MHLILCEMHMVWRRNTSATGVIQKRRKGCRWLPGYLGSAGLVLNTIVISALKTFLQGWNVGEEKVKPVEPAWHATKVVSPTCQGGRRQGGQGGLDPVYKWMEEVKEDKKEGEPAESHPPQSNLQPLQTSWPRSLSTLRPWREWHSFAVVAVVWLACQVEAPLLVNLCWRLLLWLLLGGCVSLLKGFLWLGWTQFRGESPVRMQQAAVSENRNDQCAWMSLPRSPAHSDPVALALADSLLLCVLQEPLPDPSSARIKSLLSRLESVSHSLQRADGGSEATAEQLGAMLSDKVKLIDKYLRQRVNSLCRLVQAQEDFESSVKDMQEALDGLWARLEVLHTGVTLTKQGSRIHKDLASAQTEAQTLSAVLRHHKERLQCCEAHLKDSTQLLQELTWSHSNTASNTVGSSSSSSSSSSESVWPELLLQSNIEQFDKVQESFLSLEQQISTFQAHLEGLGTGNQGGYAGPVGHAKAARQYVASPKTSDVSPQHINSTPASTSVDRDAPLSLHQRSARQFSSALGCLRKSGSRK